MSFPPSNTIMHSNNFNSDIVNSTRNLHLQFRTKRPLTKQIESFKNSKNIILIRRLYNALKRFLFGLNMDFRLLGAQNDVLSKSPLCSLDALLSWKSCNFCSRLVDRSCSCFKAFCILRSSFCDCRLALSRCRTFIMIYNDNDNNPLCATNGLFRDKKRALKKKKKKI